MRSGSRGQTAGRRGFIANKRDILSMKQTWLYLLFFTVLAAGLSYAINRWLVKKAHILNLVDKPNHRSSHSIPTPRGGGLGIVVAFIIASVGVGFAIPQTTIFLWLLLLGAFIAGIGLYDDIISASAKIRLLVHIAAIAVLLMLLEYMPNISIIGIDIPTNALVISIAMLSGIWMINLFNFMDGIDGLAGLETVTVLFSACTMLFFNHIPTLILPFMLFLMASCVGFLVLNLPPARIFMGDVGSGFLGFMLAAFALYTIFQGQISIVAWLIWLSVFWMDATYTLVVRLCTGQRWFAPHRSHAYQILAQRWNSHGRVVGVIFLYNMIWLLPLSFLDAKLPSWGLAWLACAVLPVITIDIGLKAGKIRESIHAKQ